MAQLYITNHKAIVGIKEGRIEVKYADGLLHSIPIENTDGINIIGNAQVTTKCIAVCLQKGIPIQYYSSKGFYFGKLSSTQHVNTERQRKQISLTENEDFCLALAKNILKAKLNNQTVLLRRYQRSSEKSIEEQIRQMKILEVKLLDAKDLQQLIGVEGLAARTYFSCLNALLNVDDFKFSGRSRQPPKNAFNSLLSLGYSILMNEVYGAIEGGDPEIYQPLFIR